MPFQIIFDCSSYIVLYTYRVSEDIFYVLD